MLKKILIGVAILIVLPFVLAIFIPRQYTVSVSETINKPVNEVYDYMRILNNQQQWSEWVKADPNLKPDITGNDGTIGAIQHWNSKNDNEVKANRKSWPFHRIGWILIFVLKDP